ncbi:MULTISPECIES: ABC transporter permease [Anaerococcus]|uniref:Iron ABC transporter permease n=1 Tax=Anaerococcus octavius TaxID=54007 RepID=A0A2I1M3L0_9FIRM|nr:MULTISPECIES: ABC transporter permease subunit [Anaerococcus]MDU2599295.1 ABC transporter permease subunit [Anaerococcus sp.]MDU3177216.1 ABC transporter permease subunit [Anaerococcus sp.]PKZ14699.1 iron ABC transporter permease [Anaerococcus octavius]
MKKVKKINLIDILIQVLLVLAVVFFVLMPFLSVFKESFIIDGHIDLSYYSNILSNKNLLFNSLKLATLTSVFSLIFSTVLAIYAYVSKEKIKKIINLILLITLVSPPFVTSLSYITLFGRRGFITHNLLSLSMNPYNMWGVVFMQTLSYISLNCLILLGYLSTMKNDVINSARSLGANTNSIIMDILVPQLKNGIYTVFLLSFFKSISDFATPSIIGGRFNVLALESYFEVIANGNLSKASAMNVLLLIPILFVYVLVNFLNKDKSSTSSSNNLSELNIQRKGFVYILFKIIGILILLLLLSLYIAIILSAFTTMKKGSLVFSLDNFLNAKKYMNDAMLRSIVYSLISALVGTFIGMLIGYYLIIKNSKFMKIIDLISNMPYIIPGTFFGLGYLLYFKAPPIMITGTSIIVVLNVLFKQLPFSSRVGNTAMKSIDTDVINSLRDLGANTFYEIKDGIIPNIKPSLRISLINSFTTTMTTVGSIIFLVYPGKKLLTLVMFDVINSGKYGQGSVISLMIMIICIIFNILINWMFGNKIFKERSNYVLRN